MSDLGWANLMRFFCVRLALLTEVTNVVSHHSTSRTLVRRFGLNRSCQAKAVCSGVKITVCLTIFALAYEKYSACLL